MSAATPRCDIGAPIPDPLRVAVVFEGGWITGPAKNLLRFAQRARTSEPGLPRLEVLIITYSRSSTPGQTTFADEARRAGLPVEILVERRRFDWGVLPQLRQVIEAWQPHVIQTHQVKSHFLVRLSRLHRQRLWVAFHHGYTRVDLKMLVYNQLDRWSLRAPDRVVTVCHAFARQLAARGVARERITVQHNCVEPPATVAEHERHRLREALRLNDGTPVLLSVGRLSREKGHADLLASLAELRRMRPGLPFHLVVVGEGKERRRLEGLRRRYGLERAVTFVGHRDDVAPFYRLADIVVLPSHSEGSPNVLLEAMAAQVPVVATRVGGVPEIALDQQTALLVPPRDPRAMAAALERLLSCPQQRRRLASAAFELVQSRFTPEAYQHSLRRFYRRLWEECARRLMA
ncbi:MAG: glycosyltransferase family 4 protein [Bryobacterales bacterium]|nr:glycosyltransferase family 4 protein [Bryobacteraceae bacterium]MDW8355763.1 glycosyltransferase family 4 protein [Bryobacterales bacterium]